MGKKLTHEEFVKRLSIANPKITALEKYINIDTKIRFKCECGNEWATVPYELIAINPKTGKVKKGCPECARKRISDNKFYTQDYIVKLFAEKRPDLIVTGNYVGMMKKIEVQGKECGHKWTANVANLLRRNVDCPYCNDRIRNTSWLREQMYYINPNIHVVGEYINAITPIKLRCRDCGTYWYAKPNNILSKQTGCPRCQSSRGERVIATYLNSKNIKNVPQYKFEDCKDVRPLPFDFYLPDYNMAIEYQGEQHYEPIDYTHNKPQEAQDRFEYTQSHDAIKKKFCEDNNIRLLEIPYWEFKNIKQLLKENLRVS